MSGMFLLWTKEIIPIGESALTYIRSPEKESTNWAMNICRWLWPRLCCFLHLGPSGFNTDYYILLCYLSRLAKSSALQWSSGCIVKWANCDSIIIEASLICWVTSLMLWIRCIVSHGRPSLTTEALTTITRFHWKFPTKALMQKDYGRSSVSRYIKDRHIKIFWAGNLFDACVIGYNAAYAFACVAAYSSCIMISYICTSMLVNVCAK